VLRPQTLAAINEPPILGAGVFMLLMLAGAALVVHKRVKPE
jgi:hypothetical protein